MKKLEPSQIDGWLSLDEASFLQDLCRGKVVLEIGAYKGRSTAYIAGVAKKVFSLDWHYGTYGGKMGIGNDSLPVFRANLRAAELHEKVVVLCGKTEDFDSILRDHIFDVVFIDGDHKEQGVQIDTEFAKRVVKPDGVIAYHDWQMDSVWKTAYPHFEGKTKQRVGSVMAFAFA